MLIKPSCYSVNFGRRVLPQELLQVLSRGLHPDHLLLRRPQWRLVLQDPLRTAIHGEGELQPHEEEEPVPGGNAGRGCRGATTATGATARREGRGQLGASNGPYISRRHEFCVCHVRLQHLFIPSSFLNLPVKSVCQAVSVPQMSSLCMRLMTMAILAWSCVSLTEKL